MFNGFEWSLYNLGGDIVRARIHVFEPPNTAMIQCIFLSKEKENKASELISPSSNRIHNFQPIGLDNDNRLEKLRVGRMYKGRNSVWNHILSEVCVDPDAGNRIVAFTRSMNGGHFFHAIDEFLNDFKPVENPG